MHGDKLGDATASQIQSYTDSLNGGGGVVGRQQLQVKGGGCISAAVFEERLKAFIGLLEGCHVERKLGPATFLSARARRETAKGEVAGGTLADHTLPYNPIFMTVERSGAETSAVAMVGSRLTLLIKDDAAHPLGISEVCINPNPTVGNGTNGNDNCVIHQDLRNLVTPDPS